MGSENEPAKVLLPYLQRADELQKHELLVAYYCRLYAMDRGLQIPQKDRTKTTNAILVSLMNQLEKDKKSLKLGSEDNLYVEGFASNVFAKADKQDRAGRADLNTAKTFYAASIFFEILNQFGEIHPELEQKQKYAVWKAADIRKALKEGRKPVPGPPGGDKDLSVPTSSNTVEDLGQSENVFASHHETGAGVPPQSHENTNYRSFSNISTGHHGTGAEVPYQFHEKDNYQSSANLSARHSEIGSGALSQFHETDNYKSSGNASDSSPSYPAAVPPTFPSYPSSDYHPNDVDYHPNDVPTLPPPTNRQDNSSYPQPPYQHQPYQQTESPRPPPQNYSSHEFTPPTSHPNFQSYPGFIDHSLPATPTHPPYYQPPDVSYPQQSAPAPNYQSTAQYSSTSRNEKHAEPTSTSSQTFHYDSNYMPPPEKIVEAHKAARFAVGALAFDDVAVAVDFLQKSLELLTNPSASH